MASELILKAKEAFVDDDFEQAVNLLSQALEIDNNDAELLSDRAQAYIKLQNFTEAVADASKAIQLDPKLAKAYLRKGIACMELEEYHTAKTAFEMGASIAPTDSRFAKFIKECQLKCAEESHDAPESNGSNVPPTNGNVAVENKEDAILTEEDAILTENSPAHVEATIPKEPKYKHKYYQTAREVVVTIYAKGVPEQYVAVNFGEQILSVTVDVPGEEAYHLQTRLFGKILPANCKYSVRSTNIEIRLFKAEEIHWATLEYTNMVIVPQKVNAAAGESLQMPTYPSSKPKKVDWDKLEAEVKKEEKDEKLDGDAALHKFFREIYQGADEDARRAMNKSFSESSGTVLSTNWKDVGKKKIEVSAPDGMEAKKWES